MNSKADKDADTESDDSNDRDDDNGTESSADDAIFDDAELVAAASRQPRLPLFLSLAAIVVALVSLAVGGWLATSGRQPSGDPAGTQSQVTDLVVSNEAEIARLRAELADLTAAEDAARLSLATLEQRVAQLTASESSIAADLDTLERQLNQRLALIDSVPGRVASIERSMSALRGISTGAQDAWLLSQAEYFLQVANAELELARNPSVAEKALRMADERLVEIDDPGLTDVRRQLSGEIQALEALSAPDLAGTAVTLASLSRTVDSLPIRQTLLTRRPDGDAESEAAAVGDEPMGGTERAWTTLVDALSGTIRVRRTDEAARPLIAPEAVYFLRTNLSLQLQAARLALLTGEQTLFEQSLDDAIAWLSEYYDAESTPVQSALATMHDIRDSQIVGELPDLSGSLRMLRQFIAFSAANNSGDVSGNSSGNRSADIPADSPIEDTIDSPDDAVVEDGPPQ